LQSTEPSLLAATKYDQIEIEASKNKQIKEEKNEKLSLAISRTFWNANEKNESNGSRDFR